MARTTSLVEDGKQTEPNRGKGNLEAVRVDLDRMLRRYRKAFGDDATDLPVRILEIVEPYKRQRDLLKRIVATVEGTRALGMTGACIHLRPESPLRLVNSLAVVASEPRAGVLTTPAKKAYVRRQEEISWRVFALALCAMLMTVAGLRALHVSAIRLEVERLQASSEADSAMVADVERMETALHKNHTERLYEPRTIGVLIATVVSAPGQIRLMSASVSKNNVVLHGEAPDLSAIVEYGRRLESTDAVEDVILEDVRKTMRHGSIGFRFHIEGRCSSRAGAVEGSAHDVATR
jgi:hypothetical protein